MVKPLAKVVVEKIHKENKSPQDPKPPTPSVSFAKEVDNLKQVLGVGVKTMSSASLSGNTNNAGAGAPSGTAAAGDTPSEKEKMQQKLTDMRGDVGNKHLEKVITPAGGHMGKLNELVLEMQVWLAGESKLWREDGVL